VALAVALGGDCLADVGTLRAEPAVFGPVASDPTVSRLIDTLAAAGPKGLNAFRSARSEVRELVWKLAGTSAPDTGDQVIVDLDGVLVLAHSEKRARAEDRIRAARATGLRNLPLHDTAQNQIWLEIVQLALDLLAWLPMLALTGRPRLWEPRRLRLRLFSAAAQLVTTARRRHLRFARHWPWTDVITDAIQRLDALPNPG
ncbi:MULTISPECIES: transposase, partial [unclassified Streptomyces]|uniref:transposase n=1 Tax=unclassified Streptomyces TaxID=2593676 RepID=UPI0038009062